ncbi:MAG: hypothetical protein HY300_20340 [Verrucomicrobia bacterium]|nr:hypothetical protein [Verrucomicrobiota bacterium]
MTGTFTFRSGGQEHQVTCEDLLGFAEHIELTKVCPDRWSYLLALDIYMQFHHATVSPEEVVREILFLESDPAKSRTKPAEPFRGPILQGFSHKHYFTSAHLAKNLQNQLAGKKLTQLLERACGPAQGQPFTQEMANEIVYATTHGAFSERLNANKLTGEWLVFTEHDGANYYLCLGKHSDDDTQTLNRIHSYCDDQFPFLKQSFNAPDQSA